MTFSNEIIYSIFKKITSQDDKCGLRCVSKQWNLIATDLFYQDIHLYTVYQLHSFITTATEMKYKNKPVGEHVKHLSLHFIDHIGHKTMDKLQDCCPNITTIHYSPLENYLEDCGKFKIVGKWPYLTHIPYWHKESTFECISYLKKTLKNITLDLSKDNYTEIEHLSDQLNSLSTIPTLTELHLEYNDKDLPFTFHSSFLYNIHSICTQIKVFTMANNFVFDKEEDKRNDTSYNNDPGDDNDDNAGNVDLVDLFDIDGNGDIDTTWPATSPPLSISLLPSSSTSSLSSSSSSSSTSDTKGHQWNSITTLCFKNIKINDPYFFTYIKRSYPNLESLILENIIITDYLLMRVNFFSQKQQISNEYKNALKRMVIHHSRQLKTLHISFRKANGDILQDHWANNNLLSYLNLFPPSQLKDLKWPSTIYPSIVGKYYNQYQFQSLYCKIKPISFINHLETLHLSVPIICKETLNYLLDGNKTIFPQLKELSVKQMNEEEEKPLFNLHNWLTAFPNLQSLTTLNMCLITYEPFVNINKDKQQATHYHQYKLKKLTIHECLLYFEGGFSQVLQRCSQLEYLNCQESTYYFLSRIYLDENQNILDKMNDYHFKISRTKHEIKDYYTFIYAPHLNLKTLIMNNMKFNNDKPLTFNRYLFATTTSMYMEHLGNLGEEFNNGQECKGINDNTYIVIVTNSRIEKYMYNEVWKLF
ncbi:hypothetical protein BJ944DRAFT_245546 [Cunninghamella echinulata]|nr:hypothetical protein BJ944DRAFT_245546 [Cunninghamella echinulata]